MNCKFCGIDIGEYPPFGRRYCCYSHGIKASSQVQYQRHKKRILEYGKEYRKKNIKKCRATVRKYNKNRRKTDVLFKLRGNMSNNLVSLLKKRNTTKKGKTEIMLGYTVKELKEHLEKQFNDQMNWNNYGSYWQIDHIIPLSWFKTQTQLIKVIN